MGFQLPTSTGKRRRISSINSTQPGLGSTLHGRLCWSRGTLPYTGGRWNWTVASCMGIMSWDGMISVKLKDLLAKKLSKNVRKAMAPRKEAGGGWICMKHQKYQTLHRAAMVWEAYVKKGRCDMVFEKCYSRCCESERTYRKMKKMTRKMRKRQFSKTRLTVLYWRDCLSLLLLGSNIFSFPAGTFESMIFLFLRWDMDPFPEVSLSESNIWCVSGWRCWELWHGDCRFGKMKTTWAITKTWVV